MKKILLSGLLLAAFNAFAQQPAKMDGKWKIHNTIMGNESEHTCTLTSTEKEFSGKCDDGASLTGKVDGATITWQLKSEYNGSPITLDYKGHFDTDGKIVGMVTVNEYSVDGEFTAAVVK